MEFDPFSVGNYDPNDPFGFAQDQNYGAGTGDVSQYYTQWAPTQNLGPGSLYEGATTGAAGGGASDMFTKLASKIGPAAAQGLFSKLQNGTATADDYAKLAGVLGSTALGLYGADQQRGALERLSSQFAGFGAPSRARYEGSFAPGFSMANEPGYQDALDATTKSFLHKASIAGNPADSPNAWTQTLKDVNASFAFPALNTYRNQNAATGGFGAFNTAAPGAATGAAMASGNIPNVIGSGLADLTNPRTSLADLAKLFNQGNIWRTA